MLVVKAIHEISKNAFAVGVQAVQRLRLVAMVSCVYIKETKDADYRTS